MKRVTLFLTLMVGVGVGQGVVKYALSDGRPASPGAACGVSALRVSIPVAGER